MKSFLNIKKLSFYLFIYIAVVVISFDAKSACNESLSLHTEVVYNQDIPLSKQILILTDFGPILIALNETKAPTSTKLFTEIVRSKYYNKTSFYRMYNNYFIQAGDPNELGDGNAGVKFPNEEKNNSVLEEGTVALTTNNFEPKEESGSQFFITLIKCPWLDNKYIAIGKVIYGLDILKSFCSKYNTDSKGIMEDSIPLEMYVLEDYMKQHPELKKYFIKKKLSDKTNPDVDKTNIQKVINMLFNIPEARP